MTLMTLQDWPRWLARTALLLGLCVMGVAAARSVLTLQARGVAEAATRSRVQGWHEQIALELPAEQRAAWATLSAGQPELLLRACSLEYARGE